MSDIHDRPRYRVGISFEDVDEALRDAIVRRCFAEPFGPDAVVRPAPAAPAPAPVRRRGWLGRGGRSRPATAPV